MKFRKCHLTFTKRMKQIRKSEVSKMVRIITIIQIINKTMEEVRLRRVMKIIEITRLCRIIKKNRENMRRRKITMIHQRDMTRDEIMMTVVTETIREEIETTKTIEKDTMIVMNVMI